jgi:hypothetical protein
MHMNVFLKATAIVVGAPALFASSWAAAVGDVDVAVVSGVVTVLIAFVAATHGGPKPRFPGGIVDAEFSEIVVRPEPEAALASKVMTVLDHAGCDYTHSRSEGRHSLHSSIMSDDGSAYSLYFEITKDPQMIQVYLYAPFLVPTERFDALVKTLNEANVELQLGRFTALERDEPTPIQWMAAVLGKGGEISTTQIETMMQVGVASFDRYAPVLRSLSDASAVDESEVSEMIWLRRA